MGYIILAVVLVFIDQYTKYASRLLLKSGGSIDFIPGIMDFVYVENRGAAFGILQDTRWFLAVFTIIVLAVIVIFVIKTKNKPPVFLLAATFVVAGGLGNLIDRVAFGYVTDFLHLLFMDFPCFNVADICVCVGGGLFIISLLFTDVIKGENDG